MAATNHLKIKAKLPSGEEKMLVFPLRTTVEQVKNKFFDFVPPRYRKEPYFIIIGEVVLDLEFYKFQEAFPGSAEHATNGTELEVGFITQLEAKRRKDKGEVHTVAPQAKSVGKEFVEAQKIKERTGVHVTPEEAAEITKKRAEEEERKKREEEERKKRLVEEAELRRQEEERLKREEEEKKKKAAEEQARQEAVAAGWFETQQRVEQLKKQIAEHREHTTREHQEKLAEINKEYDQKLSAAEQGDKQHQEQVNTKLEELKKIGV